MSVFDVGMPWNSVLKSSSSDSAFWDRELKEPALLCMMSHGRTFPSHVERLPEQRQEGREQGSGRKRKRNNGGGGVPPPPPPFAGKGKGRNKGGGKNKGDQGSHPRTTKEGRYYTDRQGRQLCFKVVRSSGGCTSSKCPEGRAHVCERCLQPHRAIDHRGGEGGNQEGGQRHS